MLQTQWIAVLSYDIEGNHIATTDDQLSFPDAIAKYSAARTAGWPEQSIWGAELPGGPRTSPNAIGWQPSFCDYGCHEFLTDDDLCTDCQVDREQRRANHADFAPSAPCADLDEALEMSFELTLVGYPHS